MKYIKNTLDFYVGEPTVISLGKFDGIHRGHELLMEKLAQKKEEGLKAAIFTFDIPV
jgi:riboflavin kinase / FMN adenylyltransferase